MNELEKPKFKIERGLVRVAAEADVALEPEMEIWHDDFLEDVDPAVLKGFFVGGKYWKLKRSNLEYQIYKRDQLHAEKMKKEAATSSTTTTAAAATTKEAINYGDIDLAEVNDAIQLEHYGMEHLKWALESRGLKCGGNLQERCRRLLMTKGKNLTHLILIWKLNLNITGLTPDQYPKKIRAKK